CDIVPVASPGRVVRGSVRQGRQGKAGIREANLLSFVAQHLVRGLNHLPFVLAHGLSTRFLNAILDDDLVNFSHVGTVTSPRRVEKFGLGSRGLFEGLFVLFSYLNV